MIHSRVGGAKYVEQNVLDVFSAMVSSLVKFEHSCMDQDVTDSFDVCLRSIDLAYCVSLIC